MDSFHRLVLTLTVFVLPVMFAISFHEAAHGYVARYFGDPTAAAEGRVSINPLRHIDPLGTVALPLLAYWLIGVPFGYAKPVPVDIGRLRNPRRDAALVAFAGPAANLLMGLGWGLVGMLLIASGQHSWSLHQVVRAGVLVNAAMFVFNMIPIPPLDGGEILMSLLPRPLAARIDRIRFWPANPRRAMRTLREVFPGWVAARLARLDLYNVAVFALFLVLLKFHVLDNVLMRSVQTVSRAFHSIAATLINF